MTNMHLKMRNYLSRDSLLTIEEKIPHTGDKASLDQCG